MSSPSWAYRWGRKFRGSGRPRQRRRGCHDRGRWSEGAREPPCRKRRREKPSPLGAVASPMSWRRGSTFSEVSWGRWLIPNAIPILPNTNTHTQPNQRWIGTNKLNKKSPMPKCRLMFCFCFLFSLQKFQFNSNRLMDCTIFNFMINKHQYVPSKP